MKTRLPNILTVQTALPPYSISQNSVRKFSQEHFQSVYQDIDRLIKVFDHAKVNNRYFSAPLAWFKKNHSFPERNEKYIQVACNLGEKAVRKCLSNKYQSYKNKIKHFIFVSSTGFSTPTIDARIMNRVEIPRTVKRTPIWGLGCLGGVAALSRAYDFVRAEGNGSALILTVELCSLTFQLNDFSKSNFIASSLFGDGAAAALVDYSDDNKSSRSPVILGTTSLLWPNSLDVMGWKFIDTGMEVIFSKNIPTIVRSWLREVIEQFLDNFGLKINNIAHFVIHPGGAKVLDAFKEALKIEEKKLKYPRLVLRNYGNLSSCSIFFVLKEVLNSKETRSGEYGLITALGPGFSTELILIQWP